MTDPNDTAETLLADIPDEIEEDEAASLAPPANPRRSFAQLMRKIPVTLTLEVGSARITLMELSALAPDSVIELDTVAGEPLIIKVNGTPIGRAEVVVKGENYGLKVLELNDLDLDSFAS
jgi:flagellar motor switch protein FliN/FliY